MSCLVILIIHQAPKAPGTCRGKEEQRLRFKAFLHRVKSMAAGVILLEQDRKESQHTGSLQSTCIILRSILLWPTGRDWILACAASVWPMNLIVQIGNRVVFASSFTHLCFLLPGSVQSWPRIASVCSQKLSYLSLQRGKDFQESPERLHRDPKIDFNHTNPMSQSWKTLHFTSTSLLQGHPEASQLWQKDLFGLQVMDEADQVSKLRHFSTHVPLWSPMQFYSMLNTEIQD